MDAFLKECFKCQRAKRQMQYSASVVLLTLVSSYKGYFVYLKITIFPEQTANIVKHSSPKIIPCCLVMSAFCTDVRYYKGFLQYISKIIWSTA